MSLDAERVPFASGLPVVLIAAGVVTDVILAVIAFVACTSGPGGVRVEALR